MADANILIKAKIHYYGRERYFHQMQVAAVEGIKRFTGDPSYKFYYAMALVLEGRLQEGIRELDPLHQQARPYLKVALVLKSKLKRAQPT